MAPRKTKTAAEPAEQNTPAAEEAVQQLLQLPMLDIDGMSQEQFDREQRFNVALAIWPKIAAEFLLTPLDDENEAGAAARIAFEYADAFIAQSRKGQVDAE